MGTKEAYLIELSGKVFRRFWDEGFDSLSRSEQVFLCVWDLESEVNNGGFDQFFLNLNGYEPRQTVDALEAIGATHTAGIVRQANAVFPEGSAPGEYEARQDALLSLSESAQAKLYELDLLFYEYKDNLSLLLYKFVRENRAQIRDA